MSTLLTALALAGVLALLFRIVRSGARLALSAAETAAAGGLAEVSARHGDLTAMTERRIAQQRARVARRKGALWMILWLTWLILPLFLGWAEEAFALAAPLWLLPKPSILPRSSSHQKELPGQDR
ncbi:MAG TPA: hypothetical protein VFI91_10205 [Longimicrobiaceae bacterium]|nr:hypothetical protein [Longimicrobiaceae bacterium]